MSVNCFSLAGLSLDLIGVMLLGFDVLRIQRRLSKDADDRWSTWQSVLEENGYLVEELSGLRSRSDWREWHLDEGVQMLEGTIDSKAAREAFQGLVDANKEQARLLDVLSQALVKIAESDADNARMSTKFTRAGLVLIAIGFALQIVGSLT